MAEYEVDVAHSRMEVVVGAETKAGEVGGFDMFRDRFEAVVAAAGAFGSVAQSAEIEVKIVAND